jgi:hypothetical protein
MDADAPLEAGVVSIARHANVRRRHARPGPIPKTPTVEITYRRLCGWGLRAGWMAQELMHTFAGAPHREVA